MRRSWRLVTGDGVGAAAGLAMDEALTSSYGQDGQSLEPTLRLYTYRPHVALVGRHQDLSSEVNLGACASTGTEVSRRPTGGGAIIMGPGQLGVALAMAEPPGLRSKDLLVRLSSGIVSGLARLGVAAAFGGKNDLEVGGRKIAGLGLYRDGHGGLLFHASLLADLDVGFMLEVLNVPLAKLADKAVAAVRYRVTTVSWLTGGAVTGHGARSAIAEGYASAFGVELSEGAATPAEVRRAGELEVSKYSSPAWLGQDGPPRSSMGSAAVKTPDGLLRVHLAVAGGTISSVAFSGDFNELPPELSRLESALRWAPAEQVQLRRLVEIIFERGPVAGLSPELVLGAVSDALAGARGTAGPGCRSPRAPGRASPARTGSCYFPEMAPEMVSEMVS